MEESGEASRGWGSAEACGEGWDRQSGKQRASCAGEEPALSGEWQGPTDGNTTWDKQVFLRCFHSPARWTCLCPIAAGTNCGRCRALIQHPSITLRSCGLEVQRRSLGADMKVSSGLCSFWKLQGRFHFLAFSSFQRQPQWAEFSHCLSDRSSVHGTQSLYSVNNLLNEEIYGRYFFWVSGQFTL